MAQRTVAICDGKYIGIETIYTVIHGQQINIPDKLKELREKSQRNQLFCPCGCGTNLILVAGDKNLREQHFREKKGTGKYECTMPTEGKISIDSKIVLKCWLDDKLKADDMKSRVPIDMLEDTKRKPEFTFLSREKKIALRYWRTRANIIDDRLDVLNGNLSGIKVIYVVDCSNGGAEGQYPEALMKIQDKQGFCLLLKIKEADYREAVLSAVFYEKNLDGLWEEIVFASGKLNEVNIIENSLWFDGKTVEQLLFIAREKFSAEQNSEKVRRFEEERLQAEYIKQIREEKERREIQCQRKEVEKELQLKKEEDFIRNMESYFAQQEEQVRDADGNRWIKCEFCGKIAKEKEFVSYGGVGHMNLGTCKECSEHNPAVKEKVVQEMNAVRKKYDSMVCPDCGGKLRERSGPFGRFYGCTNYPKCRYSRPMKR